MRSFAANIGKIKGKSFGQFPLYAEAPLLHIRPYGLGRYSRNVKGISAVGCQWLTGSRTDAVISTTITHIADAHVVHGTRLGHTEYERSTSFERAGIGFVSCPVLVKDAVASPDRRF